jgi:2-polyprenyl-3-methyl-5-hydroxy-6-metoxy-1,4-benzoquinol methylase
MKMDPAFREVMALHRHSPPKARAQMVVRWLSCPFARLEKLVPRSGRILDLGCGHGLFSSYLAVCSKERTVVGVDIDDAKLAIAKRAAEPLGARLGFRNDIAATLAEERFTAVVLVDVLYLMTAQVQRDLLRRAAAAIEPGGSLLVKEMAARPKWKFEWNRLQEAAAVKLLKITRGAGLYFVPADAQREWMVEAGLDLFDHPLDRGYLHPHHLLEGKKSQRYVD